MSFTICTSEAIVRKAGYWVNSTAAASNALLIQLSDEAEDHLNCIARYDIVSNYSTLTTNAKKICQQFVSDYAGLNLIAYDSSGFPTQIQAQTAMDFLRDRTEQVKAMLSDNRNVIKFLGGD